MSQTLGLPLTRRNFLRLTALATGTQAISSCGGASNGSTTNIGDFANARLTAVMRRPFIPELQTLVEAHADEWGAENRAILDLQMTADWRERYSQAARQRSGSDIAELFGNAAHVFSDRLVDVTDLAQEVGEANGGWIPVARNAGMVDGRWRAIPWSYTAHSINYRDDILDDLGLQVPTTYEALLDVATRLADGGYARAAFSMSSGAPNDSANLAYSLLWSFGGHEVDREGSRVTLDSNGTRAALAYFKELAAVADDAAFGFDEGGNNDSFLAGEIAMTQNATSIYWRALQEGLPLASSIGHLLYPSGPAGRHQLIEVNSLALFDHSRAREAALAWIKATTQPEQLRGRTQVSLGFFSPPFTSFRDDPTMPWQQDPQLSALRDTYVGGHLPGWPGPSSPESGLVYANGSIVRMFASVGDGSASINEAIRQANEELTRVYET